MQEKPNNLVKSQISRRKVVPCYLILLWDKFLLGRKKSKLVLLAFDTIDTKMQSSLWLDFISFIELESRERKPR